MASTNRAAVIAKVVKVAKKHYKPVALAKDRSLLDHLVFACCAENTPYDVAEKVFQTLSADYFDWNEVRVSTIVELAEKMKPLNDPEESATRLKRVLNSIFETHYSFDLESMKKQNIGQAVKTISKYNGSTPYSTAFAVQQGLAGHSIPVNRGLLEAFRVVELISDAEAAKYATPGLERAIPKSKGAEVGTVLHQLGVELTRSPYGPTIRKILLEIDPKCKDRLPKRSAKKPEPEPATENAKPADQPADKNESKKTPKKPAASAPKAKSKAGDSGVATKKKAAAKTTAKAPVKKKVKKKIKKKVAKKKTASKTTAKQPVKKKKKKVVKKKVAKKTTKRKPR